GTRKQLGGASPAVLARTRKASLIGAEQNHLCPVSRYVEPVSGPSGVGTAMVELARTSEPPCFSVIPMPAIAPAFVVASRRPKSYLREASNGSQRAASSGEWRRAGTAALVMVMGQMCPG